MKLCYLKDDSKTSARADRQNASDVRLVLLIPATALPCAYLISIFAETTVQEYDFDV